MPNNLWVYDGLPEYVNIGLPPLNPSEGGGYVLLFFLDNDTIRLFSSCNPGGCVSRWNNMARSFDLPGIRKVRVSQPFIRYSAVKRQLSESLKQHQDKQTNAYRIDTDTLDIKVSKVFEAASALVIKNV